MSNFKGWDGELVSLDEALEVIKEQVRRFCGWSKTIASLHDGILNVHYSYHGQVETLVQYDLVSCREIYGRLRPLGFLQEELEDLKKIVL